VRLGFAFEVRELAASTAAAGGIAGNFDGLEATGPNVSGDEATMQSVFFSGEEF